MSVIAVNEAPSNRYPLVYTRDQGTFEKVDFTQRNCSEDGEDFHVDRKGNGRRFRGFTRLLPGHRT